MPPDHDHDDYLDDEDDDFDERGILKDGRRVRVPLHMMDRMQRDIGSHFQRMRDGHCLHDGQGGKVGHRPGYVFTDDSRANDAKAEAYSLADAETEHAWKGGAQAGDSCRINGKPGVIVRSAQTGELFCQPVARADSQAARDALEESYRLYDKEISEAWRSSDVDVASSDRNTDSMPTRDYRDLAALAERHRMRMADVYQEHDRELEDTWRSK